MLLIRRIVFSPLTPIVALCVLAIGAAIGTFIENDLGTATARVLVYDALWYEIALGLSLLHMVIIMTIEKKFRFVALFAFHMAFVLIFIGAGITRYAGIEGTMTIREGESSDTFQSREYYLHVDNIVLPYTLHLFQGATLVKVPDRDVTLIVETIRTIPDQIKADTLALGIRRSRPDDMPDNVAQEEFMVRPGETKAIRFNSAAPAITVRYGPISKPLPFSIRLNDFQMSTYPGSNSPSSFASQVTVRDPKTDDYEFRIGMNEKLSHRGYNFYQTSYDGDYKGTILTVGWDPGVYLTFTGYLLFFIALIASLLDPRSRVHQLRKCIREHGQLLSIGLLLIPALCSGAGATHAASPTDTLKPDALNHAYFERFNESTAVAKAFGKLTVQSRMGRMKPMDTMNREIATKLSGRHALYGFSANQLVMGMATQPRLWQRVPMIKVKHPDIRRFLTLGKDDKYATFNQFFNGASYLLKDQVAQATAKQPIQRNTLDRALIRVDEKVHVANMVYTGNLLKLFPLPEDTNQRWLNPKELWGTFDPTEHPHMRGVLKQFFDGGFDANMHAMQKAITGIATFQLTHGRAVMPSPKHLRVELWFNEARIFSRLALAYTLFAIIVFCVTMGYILRAKAYPRWLAPAVLLGVIMLFMTHSAGIVVRWYLAGDAPLTNTYESIIYIAWSSILAALILFRRSLLGMSASLMMAGTFMFAAHLNHLDPEITNLVPVLKSFWLVVHVSVITASYGFFGVGCILGLTALLIVSLQPQQYKSTLPAIAAINELALLSGLVLLLLGNFLGSVWANESWGRYWGWDPKETWAYISIITYAVVLHMRMIKGGDNPLLLSICSVLAFGTILMTYFGVNFYLTGLHSYATGDPVPIPSYVWVSLVLLSGLITLALVRVKTFPHIKTGA